MFDNKKFKKCLEKCKKFNNYKLTDGINILCIRNNGANTETDKQLTKCNDNDVQNEILANSFILLLNKYYNNVKSKYTVLTGLNQVLILQLVLVQGQAAQPGASDTLNGNSEQTEVTETSFFENPWNWLISHLNCVLGGKQNCMQLTFLIIFLVGAFLSALGAAYKYLCKCCTCCGSKKKEQVDYREQFEQMQQEQEELRKALMDGHYFDKDKMGLGDKKDKDDKDGKDDKKDRDDKHHKYNDNDKDDKCNEK
ncbi:hypothetical protein POVCU1_070630, partial [Plasmodium ovale curtisi]